MKSATARSIAAPASISVVLLAVGVLGAYVATAAASGTVRHDARISVAAVLRPADVIWYDD